MANTDSDTPDEVLVVAAMVGDFDAFNILVTRYRHGVVRAAQAILGRNDAEDVAQDAFLLAFKALPSLEEPRRFAAWLHAITRHRAFRFLARERARRSAHIAMDGFLLERVPALMRPMAEQEVEEEIQSALRSISPDHALVLRLHFLDGMPLKRIAAFLGESVSTVKWRAHRGRRLMRERIRLIRRNERRWKENKR